MMFKFPVLALLICLSPSVVLADMNAANQALKSGDYTRAAEEFKKLAEQGNAKAQSHLGYMYYVGEGVPQSFEEAVKWYGKAAVQGDRDAQYNYAVAYAFGEGTKQDYKEAAIWYRRAAEQGHPIAQYSLGISYTYGEGVPQDEKLAAEWFIKSAEAGYENAQVMVGSLYHTGDGLPKDYTKAVEWYRRVADRGNAVAQYNLGAIYRAGKGVSKNTDEALKWYRLAAAQNYEAAQNELASLERSLVATRHEKTSTPAVEKEEPVAAKETITAPPPATQTEIAPADKVTPTPAEQAIAKSEPAPEKEPEESGGLFGNLKKLFKSDKPEEVAQPVTTPPAQTEPVQVAVTPEPIPTPEPEPIPSIDEIQVEKTVPVIKTVEEPEIIAAVPETSPESVPEQPQIKTPEPPSTPKEPRKPVFTPGTTATSITEIARPRIEAPESMQIRTESTAISTALIDRPKKEPVPEEPAPVPAEPVTEVVVSPAMITEVNELEPAPELAPEPEPVPAEAVTEVVVTQPVIADVVEPEPVIEETTSSVPEITTEVSSVTEEKTGGLAGFFGRMFSSGEDEPVESATTQEETEIDVPVAKQEHHDADKVEDEPVEAISYAENTTPAKEQLDIETDEQPGRLKSFFGRLFSSEEKEITTALTTPEQEAVSTETAMDTPEQTSDTTTAAPEPELKSVADPKPVPEMDWNKQLAETDREPATIVKEEVAQVEELRGMDGLQIAKVEIPEPVVPIETKVETQLEKLPVDSIDALTASAVAGNADAQFELAQNYYQGNKVARDPDQAFLWYRRAALQGNMEAQYTLGNMYLMGEGTTQSDIEARGWFEKASRQGHETARKNMENLKQVVAEQPVGNPVDVSITSTEKENKKDGVFGLVTGLFDSDDEEPEPPSAQVAAAKPAEPAATKPVANKVPGQSDYERGLAYSYGDGVPQNYGNAFKLFESAARLGHASAQYQLALAYANGQGVARNPEAAVEWYEKAARQGLTIAQRSLGNAYLSGSGVPANKALAYAWYSILADQGNVLDIHRRDTIKEQLTDAEIRESEILKKQLSSSLSTASTTF